MDLELRTVTARFRRCRKRHAFILGRLVGRTFGRGIGMQRKINLTITFNFCGKVRLKAQTTSDRNGQDIMRDTRYIKVLSLCKYCAGHGVQNVVQRTCYNWGMEEAPETNKTIMIRVW